MNTHSTQVPAHRFYNEGDVVHASPGCYVDGSMSLQACTFRALGVAWGFGALPTKLYNLYLNELMNSADEDGSETYTELGDLILNALNDHNVDPDHFWEWSEGSLIYRAEEVPDGPSMAG